MKKGISKEKREAVWGIVLPVLLLLGMAAYLVYHLLYHTPLSLTDDTFYRAALVVEGGSVPFSIHGASFFYTCLLHGMFLIFGNTPFAGVVLQIVLFFGCLILLYIGVRSYAGTIAAVVSMAVFGFVPVSLEWISTLTPELMYLALYLLGFCLIGAVRRRVMRPETLSPGVYVFAAFTGIYIGFLVYLDFYSIFLYFFLAVLLFWDKKRRKQAFFINGIALLCGTGGFLLSVLAIFLTGKMDFVAYLKEYAAFFLQNAEASPANLLQAFPFPGTTLIGTILLVVFAFFNVPALFLRRKNRSGAFILNLLFLYALTFLGIPGLHNGQMVVILGWSMLAGLGVYGAVKLWEKTSETVRADGKAAEEEKAAEGEKAEEKEKVTEGKKEAKGEKADMSKEERKTDKKKEQEKPAPGEPLSNPLPVPKRKSRPQADFDYPVKDADMKFDVEVADHDDFDV